MQLLVSRRTDNYAAWRRSFDADAEERGQAGLTLLQLWREADASDHVFALFEVNDRGRARAWLDRVAGLGDGFEQSIFLNTA